MTDLLLRQSPTIQTVPGENSLTPNLLIDTNDFSTATWFTGGNGDSTQDVGPGPFGAELGLFQTLEISAGTTGSWDQSAGLLAQEQTASVYVKKTEGESPPPRVLIEIITTSPFTQHGAFFAIDAAGVVTEDSTFGTGTVSILEDVGDGWYRIAVAFDPDTDPLVNPGVSRTVRMTIGAGLGSPGEKLDSYGIRLDEGFMTPQAHVIQTSSEVSTIEEIDLVLENGDLVLDRTLQTPALVSLFSDARAQEGDAGELGEFGQRGAWFDSPTDRFGSRLWLLTRRKVTPATLVEAETWAREGLEWMIRDDIAEEIEVTAENGGGGLILLEIAVIRGSAAAYPEAWDALEDAAINSPGVNLRLLFR